MADVPRLAWPLRLNGLQLAVVEQDSDEDIAQCIKAIALTRPGQRSDVPDMGIEEMTFEEQPLDLDAFRETFGRHEPRASVLATSNPDVLDAALADVGLTWAAVSVPDEDDELNQGA